MIDLDCFKAMNDVHGHAEGDRVLVAVSRLLRPHLRDGDVLARYGGDEFVVLLPNTDGGAAFTVAERLRVAVGERGYGPDGDAPIKLSGGIATSEDVRDIDGNTTDVLLQRADRALYASKGAGGDRIIPWRQLPPPDNATT
jgi:diguanylate cyclase (GGDEF)-like protein